MSFRAMARRSQQEHWEAEYNVRVRHPDSSIYYELYARRSKAARDTLTAHLDLKYGEAPRETLDLFTAGESSAIVIFVHGGFWHAHDKHDFSFVARPLVAAGISVAVLNYGYAPQVPVGRIADQVRQACVWVHSHAASFGIDPERLFIAGHSAGAHLAASALITDWRTRGFGDLLKGACLVSGLYDLTPLVSISLNSCIGLTTHTARLWSPLHRIVPTASRILVAVGQLESSAFLAQSEAFLQHWRAAGNSAEEMILSCLHHYGTMLAFDDPECDLVPHIVSLVS